MIKIIIKKDNIQIAEAQFETREECEFWALENYDNSVSKEYTKITKSYSELRKEAYSKEGCSESDILQAIIQQEFDNDSSYIDAIRAKRLEIKERFPKPVQE